MQGPSLYVLSLRRGRIAYIYLCYLHRIGHRFQQGKAESSQQPEPENPAKLLFIDTEALPLAEFVQKRRGIIGCRKSKPKVQPTEKLRFAVGDVPHDSVRLSPPWGREEFDIKRARQEIRLRVWVKHHWPDPTLGSLNDRGCTGRVYRFW